MRLLDEETSLKLDGHTVRLWPSLRCALRISQAHGPEPADFCGKILKGHLGVVADCLRHGIADPDERAHALDWLMYGPGPLRTRMALVQLPLYGFALRLVGHDPDPTTTSTSQGPALPFNEVLSELFGFATGILHWTPEAAWNATPHEISQAVRVWRKTLPDYQPSDDERARSALNATFDRDGFESLKSL